MEINKTALVLMGVSVATTAAGSVIDKNQAKANASSNAVTSTTASTAAGSVTTVTGTTTVPAPVRHQNSVSEGIFTDIVSDGDGVNIHRFQNVMWTVVSMTIYIYVVLNTTAAHCGLPTLDDTLLAISGISNAAYVGLKVNENKQ